MGHLKAMGEDSTWLDEEDMKSITGRNYYLSGLLTRKHYYSIGRLY
ncbi:MAG: hypothetical protein CM1200mP30_15880 [Pseudomonadota bacterium]|nr:MAG: hypothetical protein CM1200mP30_15880 [Pseudomonadota bacterium]